MEKSDKKLFEEITDKHVFKNMISKPYDGPDNNEIVIYKNGIRLVFEFNEQDEMTRIDMKQSTKPDRPYSIDITHNEDKTEVYALFEDRQYGILRMKTAQVDTSFVEAENIALKGLLESIIDEMYSSDVRSLFFKPKRYELREFGDK